METLKWTEQFGGDTLSMEWNKESLHPIGYKEVNGSLYPILYGGRTYPFDGVISLRCRDKSGCTLKEVMIMAACKMVYEENSVESTIQSTSHYLDHDSCVFGCTEVPFTLDVPTTIDSFDGKLATVTHMITVSIELEYAVIDFSVPFFVHFPMPLPPISSSTTATLKMFDVIEFEFHLDKTVFTVNDIITGWIRIIRAKRQIPEFLIALRTTERLIRSDANGRKTVDTTSYQSKYFEIMDTIYPCSSEEDNERTTVRDITMTASMEDADVHRYDRIPFRTFIRESMGVSPSYSLLNDQLSVDWQIVVAICDKGETQFVQYVDIDIVRGDILCCDCSVCC